MVGWGNEWYHREYNMYRILAGRSEIRLEMNRCSRKYRKYRLLRAKKNYAFWSHFKTREKSFHENTKTIILIQSNSSQEEGGSIVRITSVQQRNNIFKKEYKYIQKVILKKMDRILCEHFNFVTRELIFVFLIAVHSVLP